MSKQRHCRALRQAVEALPVSVWLSATKDTVPIYHPLYRHAEAAQHAADIPAAAMRIWSAYRGIQHCILGNCFANAGHRHVLMRQPCLVRACYTPATATAAAALYWTCACPQTVGLNIEGGKVVPFATQGSVNSEQGFMVNVRCGQPAPLEHASEFWLGSSPDRRMCVLAPLVNPATCWYAALVCRLARESGICQCCIHQGRAASHCRPADQSMICTPCRPAL